MTRVQEFSGNAANRDEVSPDMESMQEFEDLERFYDYPKDVPNFTMRRSETMKKDTPSQDGSQASLRKWDGMVSEEEVEMSPCPVTS